eukprot:10444431-Prorocentrum_lima.AAC.1
MRPWRRCRCNNNAQISTWSHNRNVSPLDGLGIPTQENPSSIFDWKACTSLGGCAITALCPHVGASSGSDISDTCN